jgi:hypothetical protein
MDNKFSPTFYDSWVLQAASLSEYKPACARPDDGCRVSRPIQRIAVSVPSVWCHCQFYRFSPNYKFQALIDDAVDSRPNAYTAIRGRHDDFRPQCLLRFGRILPNRVLSFGCSARPARSGKKAAVGSERLR